jgi:class 3 adenylate cyclase
MTAPIVPEDDRLTRGRAALARHAWAEGYELLVAADRTQPLGGPDLEQLALAAFFVPESDRLGELKERAFKAYLDGGDVIRAAYVAIDLARFFILSGRTSIASGWVRRAERLLPPDGETYAHGYLMLVRSEQAAAGGDLDGAMSLAERTVDLADRNDDADLRAWGQSLLGELKIASGMTPDGIALLEEASIAAVNGELSPFTSGVTACRMIGACRDLTDYRRASEWIEATERYCERRSLKGFPGVCRVHRAEVAAIGGHWAEAEQEIVATVGDLERYRATSPISDGYYALGEIRRLRGDLEGAEAALREAHARGKSPQPALALIRLGQGRAGAARTAIDAAAGEVGWNRWGLMRLLPARVEILLAVGDVTAARAAVDELAGPSDYPSPALEAGQRVATGRVLLAEGDAMGATRELRRAIATWRDIGAPYEIARARVALASALRAVDEAEDADLELRAALEDFRRLGATMDATAVEAELRASDERRSTPEQVHRTFMFTDIVESTRMAEALGNAAWEGLLAWHDATLRRLIAGGGGDVVNSTGDGFFAAFGSARKAVDTAISIQRALRDHRAEVGFAPGVRIGVHAAEAVRRGADYSGIGVHVAARVGALAQGGEICATASTLDEAGVTPATPPIEMALKGVSTPLAIAPVRWD